MQNKKVVFVMLMVGVVNSLVFINKLADGQTQSLSWWLCIVGLILSSVAEALLVLFLVYAKPTPPPKPSYGMDLQSVTEKKDCVFIHAVFADREQSVLTGVCVMDPAGPCLHDEESSRVVAAFNLRRVTQDGDVFAGTKLMVTALGTVLGVGLTEAQAKALHELIPELWLAKPR